MSLPSRILIFGFLRLLAIEKGRMQHDIAGGTGTD